MIKRSAQPLPRYVRRKPSRKGWAYYFDLPAWARKRGDCPVKNEPLGHDYQHAVQHAETILLPAFDDWVSGSAADGNQTGTLDWLFSEYREDRRYKKLVARQRRNHERGFALVGKYGLKNGRLLGTLPLSAITAAVVDLVYEKLLTVTDPDGVKRERRTTVNHAMRSCRRAWNVVFRRHPDKVPHINPFASMGLVSASRETPAATFEDLQAFRAKAKELGLVSLATAALV